MAGPARAGFGYLLVTFRRDRRAWRFEFLDVEAGWLTLDVVSLSPGEYSRRFSFVEMDYEICICAP